MYFRTVAQRQDVSQSVYPSPREEREKKALEGMGRISRTFSKPKNLSVPSSRMAPAFCSIFSRGVTSGTGSSFLFLTAALLVALEVPYKETELASCVTRDGERRAK